VFQKEKEDLLKELKEELKLAQAAWEKANDEMRKNVSIKSLMFQSPQISNSFLEKHFSSSLQ
jgi:hypothetical protein